MIHNIDRKIEKHANYDHNELFRRIDPYFKDWVLHSHIHIILYIIILRGAYLGVVLMCEVLQKYTKWFYNNLLSIIEHKHWNEQ